MNAAPMNIKHSHNSSVSQPKHRKGSSSLIYYPVSKVIDPGHTEFAKFLSDKASAIKS
jgi:hypothetical protein